MGLKFVFWPVLCRAAGSGAQGGGFGRLLGAIESVLDDPRAADAMRDAGKVRLSWIDRPYNLVKRLFDAGVWRQITAGTLFGDFGEKPQDWAERMLADGMCHIMATNAHHVKGSPLRLRAGFEAAAKCLGVDEAINL